MNKKIQTAKFLAKLLDSQFEISGFKFGFDPIINIVPWIGDIIGTLLSLFILRTAWQIGVSKTDFARMIGNIAIDFIVGFVPYLGVIFDAVYKANIKNVKILEKYSHGKFVEGEIIS